jgi:hypothetical protein
MTLLCGTHRTTNSVVDMRVRDLESSSKVGSPSQSPNLETAQAPQGVLVNAVEQVDAEEPLCPRLPRFIYY